VIDQKREHIHGRDCWCNPLIVTVGEHLLMPYTGMVVQYEPVSANQMALHVEPNPPALEGSSE
jgi:hypothetical protein